MLLQEYLRLVLLEGRKEDLQKKYPNSDVNYYWHSDPSRNKKYVEWILKNTKDDHDMETSQKVKRAISVFDTKNIRFKKKDINSYKSLDELFQAVDEVENSQSKTEKKKDSLAGAEKLAQNDKYKLYRIKTKKAAQILGRGTHWCITMDNQEYYEEYVEQGTEFFYFIRNNPIDDVLDKIAVASVLGELKIFDSDDELLSETELRAAVGQDLFSKFNSLFGSVGNFKNLNAKLEANEPVSDAELTFLFKHCSEFQEAIIVYKLPQDQRTKFTRANAFLRNLPKYYEFNKDRECFTLRPEYKHNDEMLPQKITDVGKSWYKNGEFYKLQTWDGETQYHKGFAFHRIGGPAITRRDGSKEYWVDGVRHNELGPAIINWDGEKEYWLNGKRLSKDEFREWQYQKNNGSENNE